MQGGRVVVVGSDAEGQWVPAEPLTPNPWRQAYLEDWLKRGGSANDPEFLRDNPEMTLAYDDRYYTGRDYRLFFKLAGVRGDYVDMEPILQTLIRRENPEDPGVEARDYFGRGLPDDVSAEVRAELHEDDADLHTRSWFLLSELLEVDWSDYFGTQPLRVRDPNAFSSHGFGATISRMQALAIEKTDGDTSRVRCVFGFDN